MGFHHGTMGLTNQESAVINEVAGQLNKASEMHKGQAEKLRSLGETKQAPPGYHYMPDGSLMANSEHNLGYANFGKRNDRYCNRFCTGWHAPYYGTPEN